MNPSANNTQIQTELYNLILQFLCLLKLNKCLLTLNKCLLTLNKYYYKIKMNGGDTMTSKTNIFENGLILSGIGVSLVDIQTVLSICLLCFNLIWLGSKLIYKIYNYLKDGKLTPDEIKDIENDIDDIENKTKGGK